MSEIHGGEDLWQWSLLEIRLNAFRWSTIPIKKFIIIRGLKFCIFSLFEKVCRSWDLRWRRWARVARCWLPPFPKCYTLDYQNPVFSTFLVLSIFVCLFVCLAKVRISKRVFQENKARQIFWKTNISYPVCVSGVKKWSFFGPFVFLKHPFLDPSFYLITDNLFSLLKEKL